MQVHIFGLGKLHSLADFKQENMSQNENKTNSSNDHIGVSTVPLQSLKMKKSNISMKLQQRSWKKQEESTITVSMWSG